jgi:ketosteroid isomerase-like protein
MKPPQAAAEDTHNGIDRKTATCPNRRRRLARKELPARSRKVSVMNEPLIGGTEEDRREILRLHEKYLDVNARFDWQNLAPIFSPAPEATFFNLNGHTYNGREHWIRLWQFYGGNVQSSYWTPYDIGGVVSGELAVVWCHRRTRRQWTGKEPPPRDLHYDNTEFVSRSTMAFRKEDGRWRVVHAHFSPGDSGPRPGGV